MAQHFGQVCESFDQFLTAQALTKNIMDNFGEWVSTWKTFTFFNECTEFDVEIAF